MASPVARSVGGYSDPRQRVVEDRNTLLRHLQGTSQNGGQTTRGLSPYRFRGWAVRRTRSIPHIAEVRVVQYLLLARFEIDFPLDLGCRVDALESTY